MTEQQKANVKAWIEALRSGKYQQTHRVLCYGKGFCCQGFCCLGVLADINNIPTIENQSTVSVSYNFPGDEIDRIISGTIPDKWWLTHTGLSHTLKSQLIHMNDNIQKSFVDIANRIESEMINNANSV